MVSDDRKTILAVIEKKFFPKIFLLSARGAREHTPNVQLLTGSSMLYLSCGTDKARHSLLGQPSKEETNPAARRPCRHTPTVLSPSLCLIGNFSPE